jgi:KaiC
MRAWQRFLRPVVPGDDGRSGQTAQSGLNPHGPLVRAANCEKTLFGVTFLVNGAVRFKQPGVLMTFEERPNDISLNVKSLGYDLPGLFASRPGHPSR